VVPSWRRQPASWGLKLESASILESIAEIAIAGFGGIAAGLGYRARGTWSSDDRLRLMLIAGTGLAVVFACFLPHVTHHLGAGAPWRVASALFLLFPVSTLVFQLWIFRRGPPAGFSRLASWMVAVAQLIALGLLLAVPLGRAGPREFGFYLGAILLALFNASVLFVRLLATSFRGGDPAA
jgi:hypothetical protein